MKWPHSFWFQSSPVFIQRPFCSHLCSVLSDVCLFPSVVVFNRERRRSYRCGFNKWPSCLETFSVWRHFSFPRSLQPLGYPSKRVAASDATAPSSENSWNWDFYLRSAAFLSFLLLCFNDRCIVLMHTADEIWFLFDLSFDWFIIDYLDLRLEQFFSSNWIQFSRVDCKAK